MEKRQNNHNKQKESHMMQSKLDPQQSLSTESHKINP